MQIVDLSGVVRNYSYKWPDGTVGQYKSVEYSGKADDGPHVVRVGIGKRCAYGKNRVRVVVWIDDFPQAEFVGADDFASSGEVLSEIKVPTSGSDRICRYPDEPIPGRYTMFNTIGLPLRIVAPRVRHAWAVVASVCDHKSMIALADLRRLEWWISQQTS